MKYTIHDKKKLQRERNVVTAKLSRDRKKLEVELMRQSCLELLQQFNTLKNKVTKIKASTHCTKCGFESEENRKLVNIIQNFEFRN